MMTVKELREFLELFPDDLEIVYKLYSDYEELKGEDIEMVSAVNNGSYVMRSHNTMSEENKKKEKKYLCFPGN